MEPTSVVIVGDTICGGRTNSQLIDSDEIFLRGFNTFAGTNPNDSTMNSDGAGEIIAAVSGKVEITEKVVSVRGKFSRYIPEIGDVIVGRIIEIVGNKWVVDINCCQAGVLLLSSVSEPGGSLRRRGRDDELTMRALFDQGDVIAAEVQRVSPDGIPFLQCRAGEKYGKISSVGRLVSVRASLVKRSKNQFVTFTEYDSSLIIGTNGYIWISSTVLPYHRSSDATDFRQNIARVANCIKAMNAKNVKIYPTSIKKYVELSLHLDIPTATILNNDMAQLLFLRNNDSNNL